MSPEPPAPRLPKPERYGSSHQLQSPNLTGSRTGHHLSQMEADRATAPHQRAANPGPRPISRSKKADLCDQGFPVLSVHRLCHRDGTPLWLVLAVLPRTEEAKNLSRTLNKVCGLSGIRVRPHTKGGPGQCHRCQLYGHACGQLQRQPRCVKCLVPTGPEIALSRDSEENLLRKLRPESYGQLQGCPKAPKFISKTGLTLKGPLRPRPLPGIWFIVVWRRYPNGDGRSPCGIEFGNIRIRGSTRACRNTEENFVLVDAETKKFKLLSFNANGLPKNIPELTNCMSEYGIDIIQETYLKPNRPRACAIAGYVQLRTDRTHARRGGTAFTIIARSIAVPLQYPH
ncbi:hypothetical protein EVAR_99357_1 [Eumeta japonica]|uniref:Nucleic-acid-binding protein from transposon X-element n=1 Tax=Eumeta variegata TaxID=151549 RepID=A0A4C1TM60_EUMVA|nr:hypothetical protein EVAR_99357_1 [Eumeta japonica]